MLRHRELGFRSQPVKTLPYRGDAEPVPLLLLVSSMRGDIPWRRLIDDCVLPGHYVGTGVLTIRR